MKRDGKVFFSFPFFPRTQSFSNSAGRRNSLFSLLFFRQKSQDCGHAGSNIFLGQSTKEKREGKRERGLFVGPDFTALAATAEKQNGKGVKTKSLHSLPLPLFFLWPSFIALVGLLYLPAAVHNHSTKKKKKTFPEQKSKTVVGRYQQPP